MLQTSLPCLLLADHHPEVGDIKVMISAVCTKNVNHNVMRCLRTWPWN